MITLLISFVFYCIQFLAQPCPQVENGVQTEKVYLHTDRTFYFPNETLWYKAYVVTSDLNLSTTSDILYVELLGPNGSVVDQQMVNIEVGRSHGDFMLKRNFAGGLYKLRAYTNLMRNKEDPFYFEKEIVIHKVRKPKLLMQLELDQDSYNPGDLVSGSFICNKLDNTPYENENVLLSMTIDGESNTKEYTTDSNGKLKFNEYLPHKKMNNAYVSILATVNGAKETKVKNLNLVSDEIDIQFLEEAGSWIPGAEHKIAFIAKDKFGKPVTAAGFIKSEDGTKICDFESYHDGMGAFTMIGAPSTKYYAHLTKPKIKQPVIALPDLRPKGQMMRVIKNENHQVKIKIHTTEKGYYQLVMRKGEKVVDEQQVQMSNSDFDPISNLYAKEINIETSKYQRGICQIALSNFDNSEKSERLLFINSHEGLKVELVLNKKKYSSRERATLDILTTDHKGKPVSSELSLAIVDYQLESYAEDKQGGIESSIFLTSELKGKIHEPSYYFNDTIVDRYQALDYVMLTHGWRTYLNNGGFDQIDHMAEKLSIYNAQIVDLDNKPVIANVLIFDQYIDKVEIFKTDKTGKFSYQIKEQRHKQIIAYTDDNKAIKIIETSKNIPSTKTLARINQLRKKNNKTPKIKDFGAIINPAENTLVVKGQVKGTNLQAGNAMDEIVVIGYGNHHTVNANCIDYSVGESGSAKNISNLFQGQVAGVEMLNAGTSASNSNSIVLKGMPTMSSLQNPLYIIDGIPYRANQVKQLHKTITDKNIEQVYVLNGTDQHVSSGGHSHVILINSKPSNVGAYKNLSINLGDELNYALGYLNYRYAISSKFYKGKLFYAPKYEVATTDEHERSDFRNTLYWNPTIQTNKEGKASLSFYNSDAIGSFQIKAEGVGANSTIGSFTSLYHTEDDLHSSLRLPPYLVLGDTLDISMTTSNTSEKDLLITSNLEIPQELAALDSMHYIGTLKAGQSMTHKLKLTPLAIGQKVPIKSSTKYGGKVEKVTRNIDIMNPYFPYIATFSSDKPQTYNFEIIRSVSGSTDSHLVFYKDVIGEVMNGIESLLRQPGGCFEQTSSSTYPNVLVLNYLRETGKSNPEIETKAMKYIESGYERLISFEVDGGGFEWFGKKPAHETLTAFGILEFVEMSQVYNGVDQKMINRTVDWLLNRRDSNGGFQKSKKGYDSFAQSPTEVANAYILYALSEAKIKADLSKEFTKAIEHAKLSKDPYKLAIMALTSHNLGNQLAYEELTQILLNILIENDFGDLAESQTIARSYGKSASIETAAFMVLAFLRGHHTGQASRGIKYILSQRAHGAFGSTQSTCMALKALIEYNKVISSDNLNDTEIMVQLNGQHLPVVMKKDDSDNLIMDGLEEYLVEGDNQIQVIWNEDTAISYEFVAEWSSDLPDSSEEVKVNLNTTLSKNQIEAGNLVSLNIDLVNTTSDSLPMITAVIGLPGGAALDHKLMKNLMDKDQCDYFEIFDNSLVLYWKEMKPEEIKSLSIPLIADIKGSFQAPASFAYLYYADEYKHWVKGESLRIE